MRHPLASLARRSRVEPSFRRSGEAEPCLTDATHAFCGPAVLYPRRSLNRKRDGARLAPAMIQKGGYVRDVLAKAPGTDVTVHGWVKTRRDSKGVHFVQINDGSTFVDLQVVVESGSIPDE